jgi:hypothetical protein
VGVSSDWVRPTERPRKLRGRCGEGGFELTPPLGHIILGNIGLLIMMETSTVTVFPGLSGFTFVWVRNGTPQLEFE